MKVSDDRAILSVAPVPVRLCIVTNDLEIGGVQRVIVDLCAGFDRSRFLPEIVLVCGEGPHIGTMQQMGVTVHVVPCISRIAFMKVPSPRGLYRLVRVMKSRAFDVVHSHLFFGNMFGRIAAIMARIPVIIATEHNTYLDKSLWRRLIDLLLAYKTSVIVTVTKAVADFTAQQEHIPRDRFEVIANGIDAGHYRQSNFDHASIRRSLGIPEESLLIGTVGRLVPQKNMTVLLEAASAIFARHPNVSLLIVGDGCQRPLLEERAQRLGIASRVIFAGARLDVRPFLAIMDVFAHSPRYEGFGLVLLEAMAAGVPVVARAVGGIPEVVEHNRSGILIDDDSQKTLENAIETLLMDKDTRQRLIDGGYHLVHDRFSRQRMVQHYQELYARLLRG